MRSSNPDFWKSSANSCLRQLVLLNWKSCIRILFTNLACFTQRKERLHEDPVLAFCSDFENDDSHILTSPWNFDDRVKELGKKAVAQKTCKRPGSYFGSHALVFCSFVVFSGAKQSGGRNIRKYRELFGTHAFGFSCFQNLRKTIAVKRWGSRTGRREAFIYCGDMRTSDTESYNVVFRTQRELGLSWNAT